MWQNKLKKIIKILEESDVNEIEVSFWGRKFRVTKEGGVSKNPASIQTKNSPDSESVKAYQDYNVESSINIEVGGIEVKAPMVGTFYRSSSPESPPFVSIGDRVEIGQTLCIIEAMKIMNEIESEVSGEIVKILPENAQPVEYGQLLFIIRPS